MTAPPPPTPPPPPNPRRRRLIGAGLAVVAAVIVVVAVARLGSDDGGGSAPPQVIDGIESQSTDRAHPPQRDVDPGVDCRVEIGQLKAGGQITNRATATSTYSVVVAWENDGVRIADATTVIEALAPGASATWNLTGLGNGNIDTTCRVVRIERVRA
jgi:hypothetical protein